ncbi:hypothetical protein KP509_35G041500 [Ceratopteris richardii]|nr:hypothetical protein KP509_35G041500 [Ceratopteris richardii]
MGVSQVTVEHKGFTFQLQVDSDTEFEVFKSQLYSLTMVPPENQIIIDSSDVPIKSHADFLARIEFGGGTFTVTLLDNSTDKKMHKTAVSEAEKADEELCRFLQAQEEALFRKQQAKENGEQVFASKLEGYISGVLQYEDPLRQAKARETVQVEELEEKALMALAKEGKRNSSIEELDHYILVQLLLWFKQSFR